MNKIIKAIIAALGGFNEVFNLAVPFFVAMLIITSVNIGTINNITVMFIAFFATLYRAVRLFIKLD